MGLSMKYSGRSQFRRNGQLHRGKFIQEQWFLWANQHRLETFCMWSNDTQHSDVSYIACQAMGILVSVDTIRSVYASARRSGADQLYLDLSNPKTCRRFQKHSIGPDTVQQWHAMWHSARFAPQSNDFISRSWWVDATRGVAGTS